MKCVAKHILTALLVAVFCALHLLAPQDARSASLAWNTFLGKNGQHLGYGITVDSSGNVYSVGLTNTAWNTTLFGDPIDSIGYQGGATDGVVAKLNSDGNVVWYRILGGGINDSLSGVKVDSSGNVYVIGYAFGAFTFTPVATPAPVHAYVGGDIDIFVAKLNSSGTLLWDTYLGSTSNDYVYGIDLDADGNIYIGGESYRAWHADFNNVKGTNKSSDGYQGYIAKLNNSGQYQWHRFLTTYQVYDLATDGSDSVYTVKKGLFYSGGWNYPAEVGKYNTTTGAQSWTTNIGSGTHDGFGIDVDASGNAFIRGYSNVTWGSPLSAHSGGNDNYIAKLNSSGVLQWNTFLGQAGDDSCRSGQNCSLSLDSSSNIYISGDSSATWGAPDRAHAGGSYDGFAAMLNSSGTLVWNMFLGGTNLDKIVGSALSPSGDVHVTGYTQQTSWGSPVNFPTGCYYCQSVAKITNSLTLTANKNGAGSGTVTSDPAGINCGGTCTFGFTTGTSITLTATAAGGSVFSGWSGGGCSGSGTCTVALNEVTSVTATFAPSTFALSVSKNGSGSGSVASLPVGVSCGADCSENYNTGTEVTLTATASAGSTFAGWGGDGGCSGTGTCTVTMSAAKAVTATFTLNSESFSVIRSGTGSGTITSSPSGVNCGADCSEAYDYGTSVTLTATASADSVFAGWGGGAGCVGTGTCSVVVSGTTSVTATFNLRTFALAVTKSGGGTGSVASSPAGVICGADCTENYNINTSVVLTATAASGSSFVGWSGSGCSGTGTCTVTMSAARPVIAGFVTSSGYQYQDYSKQNATTYALKVGKSGYGSGTITSSPSGINCGSECSKSFNSGTSVTLTATAAADGSTFNGWSGGCSGTGACTLILSSEKIATADFIKAGEEGNNAPAIHDVSGYQTGCARSAYCSMPTWVTEDPDEGDEVTTTWKEVGGNTLHFTDDGKIDLIGYQIPRGVYYAQLEARDGNATTTTSQSIAISIPNNPPVVSDVAGYSAACTVGQHCSMPSWSARDVDEDELATSWKEVGGSTLRFTDDGKVDLVNYHPARGTYNVQYEVSDGYDTTASQALTVTIPNNPPIIEEEDLEITDATYQNSKHVFSRFKKDVDIRAMFTDYDSDNLSYSWSVRDEDAEKVGFISTGAGASKLRSRIAGDVVITVSTDDGNGGVVTEEIVVSIPVPEVSEDDLGATLSEWEAESAQTMTVTGSFRSPVWPIAIVNETTLAIVALADTSASLGKADVETSDYDTYTFTASEVPTGTDPSQIHVDVYTEVDGENIFLLDKSFTVGDTGSDSSAVSVSGSWGCSLIVAH